MQSTPFRRVSPAFFFAASAFFSGSWGCAHLPQTGVEATGEPLHVDHRSQTITYSSQAKVGEVVNRDSYGNVVGTAEIYENRTGYYDVTRWQVFQGNTPIDDQDFFRIGGDIAAAEDIAAYRRSGVSMNRIGIGLMIGGGALALAGILLIPALSTKNEYGVVSSSPVPTLVMGAGGITVSVGSILTFVGLARAKREHPIEDPARANALARRYNKSMGIEMPEPVRGRRPIQESTDPKPTRNRGDSILDQDLD